MLEDMTKSTMRGISQDALGGPDVLQVAELERPEPGVSQILIRVHAAGVNPTDWKHRAHRIFLGPPPFVLGWDVSGVVEATGFGVTLFNPGDEVFGMLISLLPLQPGIADLVDRGQLRPVIAGAFPLAEAAKAHEIGDGGHVAGKLVLTME
jgi:NADPH:quinone reductase-like Zn-dependent oxidoreductase